MTKQEKREVQEGAAAIVARSDESVTTWARRLKVRPAEVWKWRRGQSVPNMRQAEAIYGAGQ